MVDAPRSRPAPLEPFDWPSACAVAAPFASSIGMEIPPERESFVRTRLEIAMRAAGVTRLADYAARLAGAGGEAERARLIDLLTVGETYFFREPGQLERFIVSSRVALGAKRERKLRVLSAGCATGEEAYTLAMLLADAFAAKPEVEIQVTGWDVSLAALKIARAGVYKLGERSLQRVGEALLARHFEPAGERAVRPAEAIRRAITFERRNLIAPGYVGPPFDLIVCRNVLIYFNPESKTAVIAHLRDLLAPAGCLFLGTADHFEPERHGFVRCREGGGRCFRRADGLPDPRADAPPHARCAEHEACRHRPALPVLDPPPPFEGSLVQGVTGNLEAGGEAAERFARALERLRLEGATRVVLDLSGVAYLDLAWVGRLVHFLKECRHAGGDVRLAAAPPAVREFLARHLVERLLDRRDSVAEAVAAFSLAGGA